MVKGFLDRRLWGEGIRSDSPTAFPFSKMLIADWAVQHRKEMCTLDIPNAFLRGNDLPDNVYLKITKEVSEIDLGIAYDRNRIKNPVLRMKKCIYGLNDAPFLWYEKLAKYMV